MRWKSNQDMSPTFPWNLEKIYFNLDFFFNVKNLTLKKSLIFNEKPSTLYVEIDIFFVAAVIKVIFSLISLKLTMIIWL